MTSQTKSKNMSFASRRNSFIYAINGLKLLPGEPNIMLHTAATIIVLAAGCIRHLHSHQWMALVLAIGLVWITETINTCIEKLCDFACKNEQHDAIKNIKDLSAAAVLIASITSVVIGIIVFLL